MRKRNLVALLGALATTAIFANPALASTDTANACGFPVGSFNCGFASVTKTSGSCSITNRGQLSEQLVCTASSWDVQASSAAWVNGGGFRLSAWASGWGWGPNDCISQSDFESWSDVLPRPTSSPVLTITCGAFTVNYGQCGGANGGFTVTWTGSFAPPTLTRYLPVNELTDGCDPA